ncbi:MAG TPA: hypothetical protein VGG29_14160 [Caulobacteraceae bacterium]
MIIVEGGAATGPLWRTTLTGRPVIAARYVGIRADCRPTNAKVTIIAPAFHGVVSVTPGAIPIDRPATRDLAHCRATTAPTQDVTYAPDPGYVGRDEFQIEVDGDPLFSARIGVGVVAKAGDAVPQRMEDTTLPEGMLLGVAVGRGGATFIDVDHSAARNGIANVRTYMVFDPPFALKGKEVVQQVGERVIDCLHRTYIEHRSYAFDEAGDLVIWTSGNSVEPIPADNANDFIARVMCDNVRFPPQSYVKGHVAALAMGRAAIRKGEPAD